ncbi:MAG: heme-binding protein [Pseudomonadota bacterium]
MPLIKAIHAGLVGVLAAAGVAAATGSSGTEMYKGYEMPPYTVTQAVQTMDGTAIELRRYAPHILAEVTVAGSRDRAVNRGFRELAGYIFGGNASGEKIAMTTPVAQARADENWTISFVMPAAFDLASLPAARSQAVRFVETDPEDQLVLRYSGLRTNDRLEAFTAQLLQQAKAQGLRVVSEPRYYFYDAPMTPPWSRRNEIAVVVSAS